MSPPKHNSVEPPWYGPVCPVVWEGRCREAPPYPDLGSEAEIQTEALAAAWQAYRIPRRRERMSRKAEAAHRALGEALPFGKTRPLTVADFADFEKAFGTDPLGKAKRADQGETGRFRCFTREQINARNDNLDISWLRDTEAEAEEHLTEPEDIAAAIMGHLPAALDEIETVSEESEETATAEQEAAA
jgi:hypothetical protein